MYVMSLSCIFHDYLENSYFYLSVYMFISLFLPSNTCPPSHLSSPAQISVHDYLAQACHVSEVPPGVDIIVYDHSAPCLTAVPQDSFLHVLLTKLGRAFPAVYLLAGGSWGKGKAGDALGNGEYDKMREESEQN